MMYFGQDFYIGDMSEAVEGGAALAWRLLATLEGGYLLLATSALLVYTVRNKILRQNRHRRTVKNVLVTNTNNLLGRELKKNLEAHGCVVEEVSCVVSDANSTAHLYASSKVDAVVVVGAVHRADSLDGVANLVTEDVYDNLRLLESVLSRVQHGGYIAWACARDKDATSDTFREAEAAFDTVLRASLIHLAKLQHCSPIWVMVGRREGPEQAAERIVNALPIYNHKQKYSFSVRNTTHRIAEFFDKWWKIVT